LLAAADADSGNQSTAKPGFPNTHLGLAVKAYTMPVWVVARESAYTTCHSRQNDPGG
jgi:hypothetical protein